jgi:hypothetical protein
MLFNRRPSHRVLDLPQNNTESEGHGGCCRDAYPVMFRVCAYMSAREGISRPVKEVIAAVMQWPLHYTALYVSCCPLTALHHTFSAKGNEM